VQSFAHEASGVLTFWAMTTGSSAPSDVHLVVLAAGLGTRYGSLKQLDPVGLEAYSILHDHLVRAPAVSSPPEAPAAWALAAYRLGDVLSSHGAVNRGLCRVDPDGWLEDVVEGRELHRTMEGGIEGRTREHGTVLLGGDARVSTNLWAFAPGAAEILGEGLASFLDEQGDDPRAECTLPDVIRTGLRDRACRVFVYPVDGDYFGVTRVEDRPGVVDRLAKRGHPWEVF